MPFVGALALGPVLGAVRHVGLQRRPEHQRTGGIVESLDGQKIPADVRVDDYGIGRLLGSLGAGERAPLQTLLRVSRRVLIRDLRLGEPLDRDAEAGLVHHHEHGVEPAIGLSHEPALGAVVVHHAGGIPVDAHLVLEGAAGDAVALPKGPVRLDEDFGDHE
jgi:hypothetical protein